METLELAKKKTSDIFARVAVNADAICYVEENSDGTCKIFFSDKNPINCKETYEHVTQVLEWMNNKGEG